MKYLVLGSAGQIGSALVEFLKNQNEEVYTFDIETNEEDDLRIYQNKKFLELVDNVDFVFFLAWDVGGSKYLSKYQKTFNFLQNNLKIMSNVFESLEKFKKPFIFTSTQMSKITESEYGLTKLLGEKMTLSLNGLLVQLWNVYGYEENASKSHVITDFIKQAKYNRKIDVLTDGEEKRQFLYSMDCCECLYKLSQQYNSLDRKKEYHISSFEWTSVKDVAEIVKGIFPGTTVFYNVKKDNVQYGMQIEPNKYALEIWKPRTSLDEGIKIISEKY